MEEQQVLLETLRPWLSFKILEFVELGYESITIHDLIRYLLTYRWRKQIPENPLEQLYQINQISINDYFDFESFEAQTSKVQNLDALDLSELL